MENIFLGLGIILAVLGVKMIYDARPIVKSYFSFGDENEATLRNEDFGVCDGCCWGDIVVCLFLGKENHI